MKVKRGDTVVVVRGDDKGKTGKVLRVLPDKQKVLVQGINVVFKHVRRSQQNPQGGRVERETPMPWSKVMLLNESTQKGERVGIEYRDGKRVRVLKKSAKVLT
ncbi:MAG: 50S ribosomal protein L24 [Planctomycetota bacterium]